MWSGVLGASGWPAATSCGNGSPPSTWFVDTKYVNGILCLQQQRHGKPHVVGVAVVERDAGRREAVAAGGDARLRLGQRHEVEAAAKPVDLCGEIARVEIVQSLGCSSATR